MALAPCLLGYGAVAQMLQGHANTLRDGNTYWPWIQNYNADDYVEAVRLGSDLIEKSVKDCSPSRIEELVKIFIHATKVRCPQNLLNRVITVILFVADTIRWKLGSGKCFLQSNRRYILHKLQLEEVSATKDKLG